MSTDDVRVFAEANGGLPSLQAEGITGPLRSTRRGELGVALFADKAAQMQALEGSRFVATNPTPGTAIAGIAGTGAFSDAESLLLVRNDNAVGGKKVILDWLKLTVVVAGTNGTNHRYVSKIDQGTDRYTSGGSAITPVNPNGGSTVTSAATVRFGALVTTAASTLARLVGNGLIRNVITVAGDLYTFDFGGAVPAAAAHAIAGTAIANIVIPHAPVVLDPGQTFVMSLHAASQTVASEYEFELHYTER